jgi:hypothetical protein
VGPFSTSADHGGVAILTASASSDSHGPSGQRGAGPGTAGQSATSAAVGGSVPPRVFPPPPPRGFLPPPPPRGFPPPHTGPPKGWSPPGAPAGNAASDGSAPWSHGAPPSRHGH